MNSCAKKEKHGLLRHSSGVSLATIASRFLGMVREMLLSRCVGGSEHMTAWAMAFMIPNLLRRLLGEGALGTAVVPIMTYTFEHEGKDSARKKLSVITAVLGIILALICVLVSGAALLALPFLHSAAPRVLMTFQLLPVLMPYSFFICIIGVYGSVMNSMNRYFLPAVASITLNLVMILCLLFVCPLYGVDMMGKLYALSVAVLVSGVLQIAMMLWMLQREGMLPSVRFSGIFKEPVVKELYDLTLPGIIGASFLQISFVIDRTMACYISNYAVPALYYSDRIIDIPIGVFAVAMGSVVLTELSRYAAKNDIPGMISSFKHALENILFLCIPVAAFTIVFSKPLVHVFYYGGKFGDREVAETAWAMFFFSLGIPAFSAVKIIVSGFNARKDMKTPVKVAISCIALNIILNLILMWPLKQGGIALSTTICSFVNCSVLLYILRKQLGRMNLRQILPSVSRTAAVSLYATLVAYFVYLGTASIQIRFLMRDLIPLAITGSVFVLVYAVGSVAFGSPEAREWLRILRLRR